MTAQSTRKANFGKPNVRSETRPVTPDQAQQMRNDWHFKDRQRKIKEANVERLANIMRSGSFINGTQIYIGVLPDGQKLILNGNHTLEAIIAAKMPQILTITYWAVRDEQEAGAIYAVFDLHSRRTQYDSHLAARGLDAFTLERLYTFANNIIAGDFRQREVEAIDRNEILAKLDDYRAAIMLCNTLRVDATPETKKLIWNKAPVLAVMLYTARHQPEQASEFWGKVVRTEMLTNTMPEQVLLNWIRANSTKPGRSSSWNQTLQARAAAIAWNKAFHGETMTSRKMRPEKMEFRLLGTPLANGLYSLD